MTTRSFLSISYLFDGLYVCCLLDCTSVHVPFDVISSLSSTLAFFHALSRVLDKPTVANVTSGAVLTLSPQSYSSECPVGLRSIYSRL